MKNSFSNRYQQNKNILNSFINSKQNIVDSENDKVHKAFDKLSMKVLSKHHHLSNQQRKILKEKRLNDIFNKDNYYNVYKNEIKKINEISKKYNNSFLISDKANNNFIEKYKELYGLTTNNKNINYNNQAINYFLNKLKSDNEIYNYKYRNINYLFPQNKTKNISQNKTQLKIKYNYLRNEILGDINNKINNSNNKLFNYFELNLKINNFKNNNNKNNNIKNLFINRNISPNNLTDNFIKIKRMNSSKSFVFFGDEPNILNKQKQFMNKYNNLNNKNYYDYYKYNSRPKSCSKTNKKKYNNNLYKNIFYDGDGKQK